MRPFRTAALLACLSACTPASASTPNASDLAISFVAQGDSVLAKAFYRVGGASDSVVAVFTAPRSAAVRRTRPANTQLATDSAFLLPAPPVAEGDSLAVTVTVTPYWKGKVGRSAAATGSYYRAPAASIDSLRVSYLDPVGVKITPKTVVLRSDQTQLFCAYLIYANLSIQPASNNDPACGLTPASAPEPDRSPWLRYASWTDRR